MNRQRTNLVIAIATLTVTSASGYCQDNYDYQTASAKLKEIGRMLQIYRSTKSIKPIGQRSSFTDCGLPRTPTELSRISGKPFSLPSDLSTFRVTAPAGPYKDLRVHFSRLYFEEEFVVSKFGSMAQFYNTRGERLPIMADFNMNSDQQLAAPNGRLRALVLRLDGSVELVEFVNSGPLSILEK